MVMDGSGFDITRQFAPGLPEPAARFAGFPPFNFVGGHNDPTLIPIEGLIEATASVLRREGQKLAMYSLAQGPRALSACANSSRARPTNDAASPAAPTTC